jgi:hypothetical protein
MPRGIKGSGKSHKPAGEPATPRRRGRKPKEPRPATEPASGEEAPAKSQAHLHLLPVQDRAMQEAERQLVAKYPMVNIKPGSLCGAGERPEHPGKRTVVIFCGQCNRDRILATSDLFHVLYCESCTMVARKDARKAKKDGVVRHDSGM